MDNPSIFIYPLYNSLSQMIDGGYISIHPLVISTEHATLGEKPRRSHGIGMAWCMVDANGRRQAGVYIEVVGLEGAGDGLCGEHHTFSKA